MTGNQEISNLLQSTLNELRGEIISAISRNGQRASGKTQASLSVERVTDTHYILFGRQAFWTLEQGRKGGKVPRDFVGIIRQWIIDKGINVREIPYVRKGWKPKYTPKERGLRAMAGAIAHSIKTNGTSLYRKGGRKDVYTPYIDKAEQRINEALGMWFEKTLTTINTRK